MLLNLEPTPGFEPGTFSLLRKWSARLSTVAGLQILAPAAMVTKWSDNGYRRRPIADPKRTDLYSRFGSGPRIRTLNLAVNRSLRPVQKLQLELSECHRVSPIGTVCQRRCCKGWAEIEATKLRC